MPTRREFLAAAPALPLAAHLTARTERHDATPPARQSPRQSASMVLAMHQNTSRAAGFRGSLEGWARAGIRYVELNDGMLDDFLESDTLEGARSLLADNDLTPVSASVVAQDLWLPGPDRAESLETWRRRCEQLAALGLERIYSPSLTNRRITREEWAATPDCIRETGEIAREHGLVAMIEFTRTSTHIGTLATSLRMIRAADHPNVRPMLDFFHFFAGLSKPGELDLLGPGELAHAHFQDLADGPLEAVTNDSRLIPGDGVAPVVPTLRALAAKGYAGALSVELFRRELVTGDPYEVASEIRRKCEAVMREAGVL
ncbi:MAG TPA: sugar phosphate isomerase/epimerase [Longimicrobiales bacterium]|nr:sugar phosphate isomerase/epimerase [Longimicrobiales bacterium]